MYRIRERTADDNTAIVAAVIPDMHGMKKKAWPLAAEALMALSTNWKLATSAMAAGTMWDRPSIAVEITKTT